MTMKDQLVIDRMSSPGPPPKAHVQNDQNQLESVRRLHYRPRRNRNRQIRGLAKNAGHESMVDMPTDAQVPKMFLPDRLNEHFTNGRCPLTLASASGQLAVVTFLLEQRADVNNALEK